MNHSLLIILSYELLHEGQRLIIKTDLVKSTSMVVYLWEKNMCVRKEQS